MRLAMKPHSLPFYFMREVEGGSTESKTRDLNLRSTLGTFDVNAKSMQQNVASVQSTKSTRMKDLARIYASSPSIYQLPISNRKII